MAQLWHGKMSTPFMMQAGMEELQKFLEKLSKDKD